MLDKWTIRRIIIILGLMISAFGFGMHAAIPGVTRSGFPFIVEPYRVGERHISLDLSELEYFFEIDILGNAAQDGVATVYLLNSSEYAQYQAGAQLEDLEPLLTFHDGEKYRAQYEARVSDYVDVYLILKNDHNVTISWTYYYAVIPDSYYPSFTLGFSGVFVVLITLGWMFTDWKRYFIAGVTINSILFFIRVFTLSNYSLGLPEIFETIIHIELYNDYQFFYLSWIPNLWDGAWAYSDELAIYLYPPLWIYTVGSLGAVPSWLPGVLLFAFNVGTGAIVYKIMDQLTGDEKRSVTAMMLYLLNPFTLFHGSFTWLNPTPYVFFVMLSFLFAVKGKEHYSIVAIAIATLYKQLAVVFFPILVILLIRTRIEVTTLNKLKLFIKHILIYSGIVGLVSLPFLIVSPEHYLNQMLFWNTGSYERLTVFIPELWMTVHAGTFWLWLGAPQWFTDTIAILLINYVFLIICAIIVYGTYTFLKLTSDNSDVQFRELFGNALLWGFVAVLCVQFFYPRGAYKFYLLMLSPFIALLHDPKDITVMNDSPFSFNKRHLVTVIFSWATFLCFRFVYFWILFAWLLYYVNKSGNIGRIWNGLKSIKPPPQKHSKCYAILSEP